MIKSRIHLVAILTLGLALAVIMLAAAQGETTHADTPHPLLGDVNIRRALAYCTDRQGLVQSVYGFLDPAQQQGLLLDTFLPKAHWAYHAPAPEYTYPYSPTLGVQLLEQAGWTMVLGAAYRTNPAGYELALELTTTTAVFRQTWAAALEAQLQTDCGIRLVRNHIPASTWFGTTTGLARRDFELGAFAWVGEMDPGGSTLYACDQIPAPENNWNGQNYMGWCNPAASQAIKLANNSISRQQKIAQYAIVQDEFARDMPSLPLFQRTTLYAVDAGLSGFAPDPIEYPTWSVYDWAISGENTLRIGLTQEPATLFPLVDSSYSSSLLAAMIYGRGYTTLDYDYQARLYTQMPTLENGGIVMHTLGVSAGTNVVDINENMAPLADGMQVLDASGQVITYTGGTINMTQLIITASYRPDLHWPNGSTLLMADLQLWDSINCNHDSGAQSYYFCDRITGREYLSAASVRYTLVPGFMHNYQTILPGAYPSERILGDGRKLKDVPAAEWAALPEIAEYPWGLGPYQVSNWMVGDRIVFTRNPYFALGLPLTPNIEVHFGDYAGLESELIAGYIHVMDSSSLGSISDALSQAEQAGLLAIHALPSPTWEHIDMNVGLFTQVVAMPVTSAGGVMTTSVGVTVEFPAGAFTDTTTVVYNQQSLPIDSTGASQPLQAFSLEAALANGTPVTQFQQPITLTVNYTDEDLAARSLSEMSLNIAYWNGAAWVELLPCAGCSVDTVNNRVIARLDHLTGFILTAQARLFLPVIAR